MNILSLQASINGSASATRALSTAYIEQLMASRAGVSLVEHDFAIETIPHLGKGMGALQLGTSSDLPSSSSFSDRLIEELERCDVLVIGAPMYNFGIPSTIKAWFDHVIRAGRTFRYVDGAPQGLLPAGKKAVVCVASGGIYSEGPAAHIDFLEPHLRWLLAFMGITEVEFIRAEGLVYGEDVAKAAMGAARDKASALALAS